MLGGGLRETPTLGHQMALLQINDDQDGPQIPGHLSTGPRPGTQDPTGTGTANVNVPNATRTGQGRSPGGTFSSERSAARGHTPGKTELHCALPSPSLPPSVTWGGVRPSSRGCCVQGVGSPPQPLTRAPPWAGDVTCVLEAGCPLLPGGQDLGGLGMCPSQTRSLVLGTRVQAILQGPFMGPGETKAQACAQGLCWAVVVSQGPQELSPPLALA